MGILPSHEITQLLVAWNQGDQAALEALSPLINQELHRLAKRYMAGEQAEVFITGKAAGSRLRIASRLLPQAAFRSNCRTD
jgi:hypothetical protein